MKKTVRLSTYSLTMTVLIITGLLGGAYLIDPEETFPFLLFAGLLVILCGSGLWYMPTSISADDKELKINRTFKTSSIPYSEISSVKLCMPTMGAIRIFASGGFMGYWGLFHEGDLGRYHAFYGKGSDCFLVTLKSGTKYMLGCKDPKEIVDFINRHLD